VQSTTYLPKCCTIHFNIIFLSMTTSFKHIDVLNLQSYTICSCCGYFCLISQSIAFMCVYTTLLYLHRQNYTLGNVFEKTLPFCTCKYNVVTQEKVVIRILKLVAQCKIYFPFNLKVKFVMTIVQKKKKKHRRMSNRIRQLLPTLIVLFHFVNIYILKNV
jgi:hypothetical protein